MKKLDTRCTRKEMALLLLKTIQEATKVGHGIIILLNCSVADLESDYYSCQLCSSYYQIRSCVRWPLVSRSDLDQSVQTYIALLNINILHYLHTKATLHGIQEVRPAISAWSIDKAWLLLISITEYNENTIQIRVMH